MSIKLRELIRLVRSAKTAAEERAVITKECALCRTAFAQADTKNRHRNVAKLLYIHMLGYPTHFAQMEALKLVSSSKFPEKRIGYLGLMLLLDERHGVMLLVTNSLKRDFINKNVYAIGLALAAIGNVASADMSRDLANEVEEFFRHPNPYLRKKACLTAVRIIRKVPELIEDFVGGVSAMLTDRTHAVQLSAVTLMIEMCKIESDVIVQFRKMVPVLTRLLSTVRSQVADYDGTGLSDPFLQCKIMHLLRLLGKDDAEASERMNEVLAQVAIGTEASKNPGYAVLYECVMTIMTIQAEGGLRTVAVNILGRFLVNQNNNNIRYVALSTLCKLVDRDRQAIQRHRNTIVDCLKDADISIRRRALDLIYALVTKTNVQALVKELLNYLVLTTGDADFKTDLTEKICVVIERFAPDTRWHIDTICEVLITAGNLAKPVVATDLIALISQADDMHAYIVYKLFDTLQESKSTQLLLSQVALWAIGEFGDLLVSPDGAAQANAQSGGDSSYGAVSEAKVLSTINDVLALPDVDYTVKQYSLNTLVKLSTRFTISEEQIQSLLNQFASDMNVDLQQRAIEYKALSAISHQAVREKIFAPMPKFEVRTGKQQLDSSSDESGSDSDSDSGDEETSSPINVVTETKKQAPSGGVDLMDLFGMTNNNNNSAPNTDTSSPSPLPAQVTTSAPPTDLLSSIFSPNPSQPVSVEPTQPQQPQVGSPVDVFAMLGASPTPVTPAISEWTHPSQVVHNSNNFSLTFYYKNHSSSAHLHETKATFTNTSGVVLENFEFQVAVPKFLKLAMQPADGKSMAPGESLNQTLNLTNQAHGKKKPVIMVRINYVMNGAPVSEQAKIAAFP